jgi:hypothetical protein
MGRVQSCRAGGPDTPRINEEVTFEKMEETQMAKKSTKNTKKSGGKKK